MIEKMPDGTQFAFAELEARDLPVCMICLGKKGQVRFAAMITGPTALKIPGFGPGKVTRVIMVNVRGEVTEHHSP